MALAKRMRTLDEEGGLPSTVTPSSRTRNTVRRPEPVVIVNDPLYVVSEYPWAWRLAKLEPPKGYSSHIVLVPKEYVRDIKWMSSAQKKRIWHEHARIIERLTVLHRWVEEAKPQGWLNHW